MNTWTSSDRTPANYKQLVTMCYTCKRITKWEYYTDGNNTIDTHLSCSTCNFYWWYNENKRENHLNRDENGCQL